MRILFLGILLIGIAPGLWAQGTTFQEQAERLQNINAFLLDFRPNTAPILVDRMSFEAVLELNPQPTINTRVGNKEEPIDPPSIVPKLRGRLLTKHGFFVGAALAPGIEFEDYTAEYISAELGYRVGMGRFVWSARASYTDGDLEGPITEREANDTFTFTNYGADLSLGTKLGPLQVYGFGGWNDVDTVLDVQSDSVRLAFTEDTYYYGAGVSYTRGRWRVNFEQNQTDDYLSHMTFSLSFRF